MLLFLSKSWGGSKTAATSKLELFVIIVNGWKPLTVITKCLILRCCSSPRSASEKSYSKCNIPLQLINNCIVKLGNHCTLLIIVQLKEILLDNFGLHNLVKRFPMQMVPMTITKNTGPLSLWGSAWIPLVSKWLEAQSNRINTCDPATFAEKVLVKKTIELFALQIISLVSTCYKLSTCSRKCICVVWCIISVQAC